MTSRNREPVDDPFEQVATDLARAAEAFVQAWDQICEAMRPAVETAARELDAWATAYEDDLAAIAAGEPPSGVLRHRREVVDLQPDGSYHVVPEYIREEARDDE